MPPLPAFTPTFLATLPSSLAVVADDTTGACDVGGALAAWDIEAVVELADPIAMTHATSVPVRTVEVRDAGSKRARDEMAAAFATMAGRGRSALMLKIDSTFRGQIAQMLAGALTGAGRSVALVAPALPAQGRHVVNGHLAMAAGKQVAKKRLGPLLSQDASTQLILSVSDLGMPEWRLLAHVRDQLAHGITVVIADATSQQALDASARLWFALRETTLLVGSAGIATSVAALWRQSVDHDPGRLDEGVAGLAMSARGSEAPPACDRVLVIVGSPAGENSVQIGKLRTLLGQQMDEPAEDGTCTWPTGLPQVRVLSSVSDRPSVGERDTGSSSAALAAQAARYVGRNVPDCVVIVGGLTARRVLDAVGASAIAMIGEIVPGLPTGRVVGGPWNGVRLVTKAGAFGGSSTLSAAVLTLKGVVQT